MRPGLEISRRHFTTLLGVGAAAMLASCSSDDQVPTKSADQSAAAIRIALSTPLLWPTIPIAEGAQLWEGHGLTAEITEFPTGNEANQSLLGGSADIATVAPTPVILAAAQGAPVRVIGLAGFWDRYRIQARKDMGISSVTDLKGKKVGIALGTSSELAFEQFLSEQNLTPEDFTIVNVRPPDMVPALQNGSVDAVNIWQPFAFRVAEIVPDDARTDIPYGFRNNYLFVTTQAVLDKNRALVEQFLATIQDAIDLLQRDSHQAIEHVAKASGMTLSEASAILDEYTVGGSLDDGVVGELKAIQEFAVASGDLKDDSFDVTSIMVTV